MPANHTWRKNRAAGLCGRCGAEPEPERTLCKSCLDKAAEAQMRRTNADREKYRANHRRWYAARMAKKKLAFKLMSKRSAVSRWAQYRAAGLCGRCGQREPVSGKSRCQPCADTINADHAVWRERHPEQDQARKNAWGKTDKGRAAAAKARGKKRALALREAIEFERGAQAARECLQNGECPAQLLAPSRGCDDPFDKGWRSVLAPQPPEGGDADIPAERPDQAVHAIVSTYHMERDDDVLLHEVTFYHARTTCGYILRLPAEDDEGEKPEGLSDLLWRNMKALRQLGYDRVELDRDGPVVDGLERGEWDD